MEIESKIDLLIKDLNLSIPANYKVVKDIFDNPYGYPALDPIRNEICKCIICGLYIASITLTNLLLERSLKYCLTIKYTKDNKKEDTNLEEVFIEGINKYDNNKAELESSINSACRQSLITKEQKKELKNFKNTFRNPYSHGSADIFKDIYIKGKTISIKNFNDESDFFKKCFEDDSNLEIPLRNVPTAQGLFITDIARENCFPYFQKVDVIIRQMLSNLKK
ncbi:MAG: hypothetical protein ACOYEG_09185 [Petrimonas sp.]|jgi:uncharacterized CHY-type Zn-finger protein